MKIEVKQTSTGWWVVFIDGVLFYGAGTTRQAALDYLKQMRIKFKESEVVG